MSFFRKIFGGSSSDEHIDTDMELVVAYVKRNVEIINESLHLANDSNNPETKLYRLELAKEKLEHLKQLSAENSFLSLTSLSEVEASIQSLEYEFMSSGLREIVDGNSAGTELEKAGKVGEAITEYEKLVQKGVDTPFTYRRLAILYRKEKKRKEKKRKEKRRDDELRIVNEALDNIPKSNSKHYDWFKNRLTKLAK
jgi:tetratricopeptide (TPR) repeat protein